MRKSFPDNTHKVLLSGLLELLCSLSSDIVIYHRTSAPKPLDTTDETYQATANLTAK
jgi:hypothetical protein